MVLTLKMTYLKISENVCLKITHVFRFLLQQVSKLWISGLLHRVVLEANTSISKEYTFIFRVDYEDGSSIFHLKHSHLPTRLGCDTTQRQQSLRRHSVLVFWRHYSSFCIFCISLTTKLIYSVARLWDSFDIYRGRGEVQFKTQTFQTFCLLSLCVPLRFF
jgi:hypothetical protein